MNPNVPRQSSEYPVAARFSFSSPDSARFDNIVQEGMKQKRVLSYPTPDVRSRELQARIADRQLILGRFRSEEDGLMHFTLPISARPISHDAGSETASTLGYNDTSLFFDLGNLLGATAAVGEDDPLMIGRPIGGNVAIVEFTRLNEPKLLLVPGFETTLWEEKSDDSALQQYSGQLHQEFGDRYLRHAEDFAEGFRVALEG